MTLARGKICGETCTLCDPADPTCSETDEVKTCTDAGLCVPQGTGEPCADACSNVDCSPGELCVEGSVFAGTLVISEFMANPSAVTDSQGEWIELTNTGTVAIPANTVEISDSLNTFSPILGPQEVAPDILPNTSIVVARTTDSATNGGIEATGILVASLNNGGDSIQVWVAGGITDVVDYSGFEIVSGQSNQFDGDLALDPVTNDDSLERCLADSPIPGSVDSGTPELPTRHAHPTPRARPGTLPAAPGTVSSNYPSVMGRPIALMEAMRAIAPPVSMIARRLQRVVWAQGGC